MRVLAYKKLETDALWLMRLFSEDDNIIINVNKGSPKMSIERQSNRQKSKRQRASATKVQVTK